MRPNPEIYAAKKAVANERKATIPGSPGVSPAGARASLDRGHPQNTGKPRAHPLCESLLEPDEFSALPPCGDFSMNLALEVGRVTPCAPAFDGSGKRRARSDAPYLAVSWREKSATPRSGFNKQSVGTVNK